MERTDGGLIANGLWSFASGVDFADWNNMQVFVPREEGGVAHHMALVPKSDYRVIDDWFSNGMAATGSRSIENGRAVIISGINRHVMSSARDRARHTEPGPCWAACQRRKV